MRWMSRAVAIAAVLTPTLASLSLAQRRPAAETGFARREAVPATVATLRPVERPQPAASTTSGPTWSALGGIATGDSPYDLGFALGLNGLWHRSDWPVGIRGDAYFAHHGGGLDESIVGSIDVSVNIFGVMGNAQYDFSTTSKLKPYVIGGLGIFYSNVNVDYNGIDLGGGYDSSTDLGFGIGGGISLSSKFGLEARFMDIGGFNTIPILAVWHF
jgi:opacity protein-like surface antigen